MEDFEFLVKNATDISYNPHPKGLKLDLFQNEDGMYQCLAANSCN
jgi:hypothetical protein